MRSARSSPTWRTDRSPAAPPAGRSGSGPRCRSDVLPLEGGRRGRGVDVGGAHLDPVAAGVLHQRVRRVEAHGLGVEQRRAERGRVVQLDPRARVDEVGEGHRVALGEAEVGEGGELVEDLVGHLALDAPLGHALVEPGPQPLHPLAAALRAHGLAQLVGLARGEPGHVDGHLHELLLEQRHAEGLGQRLLEQRVQVGDRLLAVAPTDVGVHRPALDRPGPDERDLDHQVVERAGLEPGQRGHLGPALDLEHADRVGLAQHVVDGLLLGDLGQVEVDAVGLGDEVDRVVQRGEHAQAEQVELHQADRGAVVLVPLQHGAVLHAAPLDRAHLDHRPVAQHHAARVDAEVAGEVLDLQGQVEHRLGDVVAGLARAPWLRRPGPTGRPASTRRPAGRGRSRAPWPCRAPTTWPGR